MFADQEITGVVIALGGKTADVGKTMLTDGTTNIITAMKEKDVSRVAAMTSIGAGDSEKQAPFFFKAREDCLDRRHIHCRPNSCCCAFADRILTRSMYLALTVEMT